MDLRRRIEDALLARFADNERRLNAARDDGHDPALIAQYEAYRSVLTPIVTEIVVERRVPEREME
jgi:hypothetical protein